MHKFQAKHDIMHRLFVAIRPPPHVRAHLTGMMGGIAGARWQDDAQLHLTLRFIGEVDGARAEDVLVALSRVRQRSFDIALEGISTFQRKRTIDTLWAGVAPADDLALLHRKIDHALVQVGLGPEGRSYKPHITLARFGKHGADVSAFAALHGGLKSAAFPIDDFHLFESTLGSQGAHYRIVESFPLLA
jgi:RNA 2',3'-cyclic 3'-phosphodiesterase